MASECSSVAGETMTTETGFSELDALQPIRMVIHGNARGQIPCAGLRLSRRVQAAACPAQWSKHGKRAGPMRNEAMLGHSPDLVLGFSGRARNR